MQNYCKTIGAMAAVSALVAGNAMAEVEYELHTGYTSEYLWRGQDLGNDLIEAGADVSAEVGGINLSAGAWYGSFKAPTAAFLGGSTTPTNETIDTDELDLYAEVSKDFGFLTASVGYIYYAYDQATIGEFFLPIKDQQEVYFGVSRDLGFAEASFTYFWDIVGDNEGYSELALSRSFELSPCLSLNVGSNVSYLFEHGQAGSWTTKVSLDYGFAEHAKISPFVATSIALSDDNDSFYTSGSTNQLVAGAMLSVGF